MPSDARSEILDLERGLPTSREDVAALKKSREQRPITTQEFLRFLAGLPAPTYQTLRSRRGPRGDEPFRL